MKLCIFVSLLDNAPNYVSWVHPNRSQHSKFWNVSLDNFPNYWGVQFHPPCQTPILIQGSLIYPLPYGPLSPNYYILLTWMGLIHFGSIHQLSWDCKATTKCDCHQNWAAQEFPLFSRFQFVAKYRYLLNQIFGWDSISICNITCI